VHSEFRLNPRPENGSGRGRRPEAGDRSWPGPEGAAAAAAWARRRSAVAARRARSSKGRGAGRDQSPGTSGQDKVGSRSRGADGLVVVVWVGLKEICLGRHRPREGGKCGGQKVETLVQTSCCHQRRKKAAPLWGYCTKMTDPGARAFLNDHRCEGSASVRREGC